MYSYVCPDIAKEFAKYDKQPEKYFKTFSGTKVCPAYCVRSIVLTSLYFLWIVAENDRTALDVRHRLRAVPGPRNVFQP